MQEESDLNLVALTTMASAYQRVSVSNEYFIN